MELVLTIAYGGNFSCSFYGDDRSLSRHLVGGIITVIKNLSLLLESTLWRIICFHCTVYTNYSPRISKSSVYYSRRERAIFFSLGLTNRQEAGEKLTSDHCKGFSSEEPRLRERKRERERRGKSVESAESRENFTPTSFSVHPINVTWPCTRARKKAQSWLYFVRCPSPPPYGRAKGRDGGESGRTNGRGDA